MTYVFEGIISPFDQELADSVVAMWPQMLAMHLTEPLRSGRGLPSAGLLVVAMDNPWVNDHCESDEGCLTWFAEAGPLLAALSARHPARRLLAVEYECHGGPLAYTIAGFDGGTQQWQSHVEFEVAQADRWNNGLIEAFRWIHVELDNGHFAGFERGALTPKRNLA